MSITFLFLTHCSTLESPAGAFFIEGRVSVFVIARGDNVADEVEYRIPHGKLCSPLC